MTAQSTVSMTPEDFRAVAQKLEQFSRGLPSGEQAALGELLRQAIMAAGGESDVTGYDLNSVPFPQGDVLQAFGVA